MNFDFTNSHTTYSTHGFHTYPAKMIPQIASALLNEYGMKANVLFDPYCGTGTTLVEAATRGIKSYGFDLNPLARLIATSKTTCIEMQSLELHLKDFYDYLFKFRFGFENIRQSIIAPNFKNIDFWFSKAVKTDLAIISQYIGCIENVQIRVFFQVALSQTIRECSWTRKNEFKLYKMSAERLKIFKPDALSTFEKVLGKNKIGLEEFMKARTKIAETIITGDNSVNKISKRLIPDGSVDIVLTSPPYGDSSTTVAYGQFSALANQWLGFRENGRSLDNELMGGGKPLTTTKFKSAILNDHIQEIKKVDSKRALDVISFYKDYAGSIKNVARTVKNGGFSCYVVSNRNVKGITLQTDTITKDFFQENGFRYVTTFHRKISSKRMPRQNSASGIKGETNPLMNTESIVVMQKAC
jgi:site-specific DNA-methyltransferase (cytosine-N4-specific)